MAAMVMLQSPDPGDGADPVAAGITGKAIAGTITTGRMVRMACTLNIPAVVVRYMSAQAALRNL